MTRKAPILPADILGIRRLVIEATIGIILLVKTLLQV